MKYLSRNNHFALAAILMMAADIGSAGGSAVAENTNVDGEVIPSAGGVPSANAPALSTEEQAAKDKKDAEDKEVLLTSIKAKFNNLVDIRETNFGFRTVKNEVKDPETGAKSTIETKRATVSIPVPVPSLEGVIEILSGGPGKQVDLLLEAVTGVILEQAREYINEHEEVNADNFPYEMLSWEAIANLPKAERRGGGISKELWEDFAKDYVEVMPGVTGKKKESVEMAAKVFVAKFAGATTNKPVLKLLQQQLAVYATNTTQGEALAPCIEFLMNKIEKLLNTDETNLLLAL
jgi:hypothetical protein